MKRVVYALMAISISVLNSVALLPVSDASAAGYFTAKVQNPGIVSTSNDQISYNVSITANSIPSYLLNTTYVVYPIILQNPNMSGEYYMDEYRYSSFVPTTNGSTYTVNVTTKLPFIGTNYLSCFALEASGLYGETFQICDESSAYAVNYTGKTTPIYRFWSDTYKYHFYTNSVAEMTNVATNMTSVWWYEGNLFSAAPISGGTCSTGSPVYRFWSDAYKGHFYTISAIERNSIINTNPNWKYEGPVYCAGETSTNSDMPTPLYRFWSDAYKGHFYTTSIVERDNVINTNPNWKYEGIAFYVK